MANGNVLLYDCEFPFTPTCKYNRSFMHSAIVGWWFQPLNVSTRFKCSEGWFLFLFMFRVFSVMIMKYSRVLFPCDIFIAFCVCWFFSPSCSPMLAHVSYYLFTFPLKAPFSPVPFLASWPISMHECILLQKLKRYLFWMTLNGILG